MAQLVLFLRCDGKRNLQRLLICLLYGHKGNIRSKETGRREECCVRWHVLLTAAPKSDVQAYRASRSALVEETVIEMLPRTPSLLCSNSPCSFPLSAHMKNKSEFQVTIQSIPSQSAIIGWRHTAAELKSIGQQGWRRPNWCQLRLQRYCRSTGLHCRPLWQATFNNSLYHSSHTTSSSSLLVFPLLWLVKA